MPTTQAKTRRSKPSSNSKKPSSKDKLLDAVDSLYMPEGETSEPSNNLLDHCILIYGESGIGKTSVVKQIPGLYMIQCDPNRKGLSLRQSDIPNKSLTQLKRTIPEFSPWQLAEGLIEKLCDDDTVSLIAIDNFGLLYEHAMRHRCWKLGINDPSEKEDFGKTWREIEDMMTAALNQVLYSGKGLILITHDTSKEVVKGGSGGKFERVEPDVMKAAFRWLKACTDFGLYMTYSDDRSERIIKIRGGRDTWLKCSVDESDPHFMDPDGNPVEQISAGSSASEAWENLNKSWNNQLRDADWRPVGAAKKKTKKRRRSSSK